MGVSQVSVPTFLPPNHLHNSFIRYFHNLPSPPSLRYFHLLFYYIDDDV